MHALRTLTLFIPLLCTACGGGGAGSDNGGSGTGEQWVAATLLAPSAVLPQALRLAAHSNKSAACAGVPAGYNPLANATIEFVDDDGQVLNQAQTDECGHFREQVASGARRAVVRSSGYRDLTLDLAQMDPEQNTQVSTIATTAHYAISVLQLVGSQKLAFIVSDDETGKAVLGLQGQHFESRINRQRVNLSALGQGAATAEAASIALVLDASGSMDAPVDDYDDTTRRLLAYDAAHSFVDGLEAGSGQDELGSVIFSTSVTTMNSTTFNSLLNPMDRVTRQPVQYDLGNGLSTDLQKQRLVLEAYLGSAVFLYQYDADQLPDPWEWFGVAPHAASPQNLLLRSSYPWGGGTALYDALGASLQLLDQASRQRRIVVALTDGIDTFSTSSRQDVITMAAIRGIPLYLIGLGPTDDIDETGMKDMASASGGEYKHASGRDLSGLFQGIQTGIRFQYVGTLDTMPASGDSIELTLVVNGERVSRSIVVQ